MTNTEATSLVSGDALTLTQGVESHAAVFKRLGPGDQVVVTFPDDVIPGVLPRDLMVACADVERA